jgi:hypothetical protein
MSSPPSDGIGESKKPLAWWKWLVALVLLLIVGWLIYPFRAAIVAIAVSSPVTSVLVFLLLGIAVAWRFGVFGGTDESSMTVDQREKKRDIIVTVIVLVAGLIFGLRLATAASDFAPKESQAAVMQIAIGWALGYFALGFVTGFLFGIPRVLQGESRKPGQDSSGYEQRVNTNLEQISDWLTKIIVGLGLVQLRTVPDKLYHAATWMAQSFVPSATAGAAPPEAATSFAGALIIFFSVLGFLGGYLTTRLFLAGAFGRADRGQVVVETTKSVTGADRDVADKANAEKLRSYWKPGDVTDSAHQTEIENWLKSKGRSDVKLADLVFDSEYADLRKEAVTQFKL